MKKFEGYKTLHHPLKAPVVCIGNFDGVHLAHQRLVEIAKQKARNPGSDTVVYAFKPHPQIALNPARHLELLTTYEEREELIDKLGVDVFVEEPFSRTFSTIEPEQFFNEVLIHTLGAKEIVVGYDFGFGRGRTGHLEQLEKFCKASGVALTIVAPHREDSDVVSSTRIRDYLKEGNVKAARKLLGYSFFYRGVVAKGDGRGRKIGFPTANVKLAPKLALPYGVYVTKTIFKGKEYPSVTNIGVRPTFHKEEMPAVVETHLLDQDIDLYGETLEVQFLDHLRGEKKFPGVDALIKQIGEDVRSVRKFFG